MYLKKLKNQHFRSENVFKTKKRLKSNELRQVTIEKNEEKEITEV